MSNTKKVKARKAGSSNGAELKLRPQKSIVVRKDMVVQSQVNPEWGYKIRPLSPFELTNCIGGLADLSVLLKKPGKLEKRLRSSPREQERVEESIFETVSRGLIDPAVTTPEEVWALGFADVVFLYGAILDLSGFNDGAAEEVSPLSAAPPRSSRSTPSESATGSGPARTQR